MQHVCNMCGMFVRHVQQVLTDVCDVRSLCDAKAISLPAACSLVSTQSGRLA